MKRRISNSKIKKAAAAGRKLKLKPKVKPKVKPLAPIQRTTSFNVNPFVSSPRTDNPSGDGPGPTVPLPDGDNGETALVQMKLMNKSMARVHNNMRALQEDISTVNDQSNLHNAMFTQLTRTQQASKNKLGAVFELLERTQTTIEENQVKLREIGNRFDQQQQFDENDRPRVIDGSQCCCAIL